jgi:hypothetical protein
MNKRDLVTYAENIVGVKLRDICVEATYPTETMGEVEITNAEEFASICLTLKEGSLETLLERLKESGKEPIPEGYTQSELNINDIANKMKSEKMLYWYSFVTYNRRHTLITAPIVRTPSVIITEATNCSEGNTKVVQYFYLFG